MAIKFDPDTGEMILDNTDVNACPTDPMDQLQCDSCQ